MKAARLTLLAFACLLPFAASAQWQWLDKDGRKVFSDKAPPPEIPTQRILKGPKGHMIVPVTPPAATDTTAESATPGNLAVSKPLGKDKTLEERRKQLAAAEADKRKAEDDKHAALRLDNCNRAKSARATYQSGVRLTRVDSKGEHQYLDDAERAAELKRIDEIMARDCVR
jgi:type IV secretory pathway VirB10-like protein